MMKGCIFDIKKFAVHDGPGIRTTVFFKGCSLKCIWCHNPESISPVPQLGYLAHKCASCGRCATACPNGAHTINENHVHVYDRTKCISCGKCVEACYNKALTKYGQTVSVDELLPVLLEDYDFYESSGGGVTLSGGEPLLQSKFCIKLLEKLRENEINTAVDTCGFVPRETIMHALPLTDIFLFDIKHMDSASHQKLTGRPNEPILENLREISKAGARVEIRVPFIPGYNNDEKNLRKMGDFLSSLKGIEKIKLLQYNEFARNKYVSLDMEDSMPQTRIPDNHELRLAAELLCKYGLNAVSGLD